jgi:multimeric flavodoxin WrbA
MKIISISCSNVLHKRNSSASTKVCELVGEIIRERDEEIQNEIVRLVDYQFTNCKFCGKCFTEGKCVQDDGFNRVYEMVIGCDRLVLVVPFYSVIPSKLTMLMEKMNQIYYTSWLKNPEHDYCLKGKRVAIIAHGGSNLQEHPEGRKIYRELLLKSLNYSLKSFGFEVTVLDGSDVGGEVFGVTGYKKSEGVPFPDMVHNWVAVKETIRPLIDRLIR